MQLLDEIKNHVDDRRTFIANEVDYVCNLYAKGDTYFGNIIRSFASAAKKILEQAKTGENYLNSSGSLEKSNIRDVLATCYYLEMCYQLLVIIFQDLLNSSIQRRGRRLFQGMSAKEGKNYSFAEAHPAYYLSVRSLEAANSQVASLLSPFLDFGLGPKEEPCRIGPPPIVLSGARFFALRGSIAMPYDNPIPFMPDLSVNSFTPPWKVEAKHEEITTVFNLQAIHAPRWFPSAIRYTPLIFHEWGHRLIHLIYFVLRAYYSLQKSPLSAHEKEDLLEPTFNLSLLELTIPVRKLSVQLKEVIKNDLKPLIEDFLNDRGYPLPLAGGWGKLIQKLTSLHLQEFLADVTGLILGGPAFVFSLIIECTNAAYLEPHLSPLHPEVKHPPILARITLLTQMLEHFGFSGAVREINKFFPSVLREYLETPYAVTYEAKVLDLFALFNKYADTLCSLVRKKHPNAHLYHNVNEGVELATWEKNFEKVNDGKVYREELNNATVAELCNSIWWSHVKQEPFARFCRKIAWRLAAIHSEKELSSGVQGV